MLKMIKKESLVASSTQLKSLSDFFIESTWLTSLQIAFNWVCTVSTFGEKKKICNQAYIVMSPYTLTSKLFSSWELVFV